MLMSLMPNKLANYVKIHSCLLLNMQRAIIQQLQSSTSRRLCNVRKCGNVRHGFGGSRGWSRSAPAEASFSRIPSIFSMRCDCTQRVNYQGLTLMPSAAAWGLNFTTFAIAADRADFFFDTEAASSSSPGSRKVATASADSMQSPEAGPGKTCSCISSSSSSSSSILFLVAFSSQALGKLVFFCFFKSSRPFKAAAFFQTAPSSLLPQPCLLRY